MDRPIDQQLVHLQVWRQQLVVAEELLKGLQPALTHVTYHNVTKRKLFWHYGYSSCCLFWLATKSTNTHAMCTFTLGTRMCKSTAQTVTTLVEFKAITLRDRTGLWRAWPVRVHRVILLPRYRLLGSYPQFLIDGSLTGKRTADYVSNNENSRHKSVNHAPGCQILYDLPISPPPG